MCFVRYELAYYTTFLLSCQALFSCLQSRLKVIPSVSNVPAYYTSLFDFCQGGFSSFFVFMTLQLHIIHSKNYIMKILFYTDHIILHNSQSSLYLPLARLIRFAKFITLYIQLTVYS